MNIPSLPVGTIVNKDGTIHENLTVFLTQLVSELRGNLSATGYVLPQLTDVQISSLSGPNAIKKIIYNSTTGKAMLNNNGTFQTIGLT